MAWTTPRTWVALEVVTGAELNTVRDNLRFLKGDDSWLLPDLLNGWVSFGTPYFTARYKLIGKVLKMTGLVKDGTVSTVTATGKIFTLPLGYRPAERMSFAVLSNNLFGRVDVEVTGEVIAYAGSASWFSLANVNFVVL